MYRILSTLGLILSTPTLARMGRSMKSQWQEQQSRQLQMPYIELVGNDGVPSSAFPLGLCEGDCDDDSDCGPNLICFQRDDGDAVPGCQGGETDNNRADYCIAADTTGTVQSASSLYPPPPAPLATAAVPAPAPTDSSFRLKLYWQQGYYWQEETFERKWCLRCRAGMNACAVNDKAVVVNCDIDPNEWQFIPYGDEVQIQVSGYDICLEATPNNVYQRPCDATNPLQRWVALNGSFDGPRFEIAPITNTTMCATQNHHPKNDEVLYLEYCPIVRQSTTSFWNKY